ncbi:MAG: MFS transporter [Planctomycetes bacterium]|nr:MFS transporter [Planctomycetota bacterium]
MEPWRRNFRVVWGANFVTAIGMTTFLPLFPLHLREIGVVDGHMRAIWSGALVAAAPLTAAFMGPVWGALGDRVGRKPMLLRANAAIVLFVGAMSFATTPWMLLALRLLQGVFSGFIAPAMTLVSVSAPAQQQGRIAGTLHTSVLAGNIAGPAIGGWIGDQYGHHWTFLVCAALSLAALVAIALGVEEVEGTRADAPTRERTTLAVLLRDAAAFLQAGPLRTMVLGVLAVRGGAVLADPILADYIATLRGADETRLGTITGLAFGATALATLLVTPWWGRIGDERGHSRLLSRCGAAAAICLLPQALVGHVGQLAALRFASGVFLAGVLPSAFGLAAKLSPIEQRGAANGFMFAAIGLASAIGPLLGGACAGALDGTKLGIRPLFVVSAVLVLGGAWWLRRRVPTSADASAA